MRKAIATVVTVVLCSGAALAVVPGAFGATSVRCGIKHGPKHTYSQRCAKPKVHFKTPRVACRTAGPRYQLPKLTFSAQGGIRTIRIRMQNPPRFVWAKRFTGYSHHQYRANHVHVATNGLSAGAHTLRITLTDAHGTTVSRTMRFAICKTAPVFTG